VSARLAGLLEPARAVEVASRLSTPFLAEIAVELDPRRANAVIANISPRQIAAVTGELVARREYVTMGRYVGHLGDDALAAALEAMDDASLLQVAFVLEDKRRLERLVEALPEPRLAGIVHAAAAGDLWVEAMDLLNHVSESQRDVFVAITLELEPVALEAIIAAVIEHDLWQEVLVIAEQDARLQGKLVERVPTLSRRQRRAIAARAREGGAVARLGALGQALVRG